VPSVVELGTPSDAPASKQTSLWGAEAAYNGNTTLSMSTHTRPFKPFVPEHLQMRELTLRAVLLGLCMTVVLGAANAYLGLRAGITIAATYPAAVIGMAVLRVWRGSLLEENIARTSGSIGEGVAAGAIFTIPAFLIS